MFLWANFQISYFCHQYSNQEFILIPNEFRELKMNVGILSQDFSDKEWRQEWENHL